jgi:hypothetical protein
MILITFQIHIFFLHILYFIFILQFNIFSKWVTNQHYFDRIIQFVKPCLLILIAHYDNICAYSQLLGLKYTYKIV